MHTLTPIAAVANVLAIECAGAAAVGGVCVCLCLWRRLACCTGLS